MKPVWLLAASCLVLTCASTVAHADTVYTSAASYAAAATDSSLVTFGTTAYPKGFQAYAAPGTSYRIGNITFNSSTAYSNITNANYYNTVAGKPIYPDGNYLALSGGTTGVDDVLTISFPAATAFALQLGGDFAPGETFTYLLSDGFSGTFTANSYITSGNPIDFLGFTTTQPITSAVFTSAENGNPASYDTVAYGTAITPEPSSLMLLGTGVLAVAGRMWRVRLSR